jgi:NhaP-type Na+/H+ or K+/H+ antiporter
MLIAGLCIGAIDHRWYLGAISFSDDIWLKMDADLILYMFLPPLIYESAASCDVHVWSRATVQIITMAGPGVLVHTIMVALVAFYIFPYNWTSDECITFAAMLSATDPVAVVALLKELGAPVSLGTIIEGEALLNDGTAYVLFLLFLERAIGSELSPGDIVLGILYGCIVGALVGYAMGLLMMWMMGSIFNDHVGQALLTIVFCWLGFYIGDGVLQSSGVITVVGIGLCYADQAHSCVSEHAHHGIEAVWEAIGFAANTIVFSFSGLLVYNACFSKLDEEHGVIHEDVIDDGHGRFLSESSDYEEFYPLASDWGWLWIFWILLNIIRFLTHICMLPILSKSGYGFSFNDVLVSTHGGLRGAVGLALGIAIVNNELFDKRAGEEMFFHISGIVILTLMINGTTADRVVLYLGLNRSSAAGKRFFFDAQRNIDEHVQKQIGELQHSENATLLDWEQVLRHVPIMTPNMEEYVKNMSETLGVKQSDKLHKYLENEASVIDKAYYVKDKQTPKEVVIETRIRFLHVVKAHYVHQYESQALTKKPLHSILLHSIDLAQDDAFKMKLSDWTHVESSIESKVLRRAANWLKRLHLDNFVQQLLVENVTDGYVLGTMLIEAHLHAQAHFTDHFSHTDGIREIVRDVVLESQNQVAMAQAFVTHIEEEFEEIIRHCATKFAIEHILQGNLHHAEHLKECGDISKKELAIIASGINNTKLRFWRHLRSPQTQSNTSALGKSALFQNVPTSVVEALAKILSTKNCLFGNKIVVRGEYVTEITFVVKGKVGIVVKSKVADVVGDDNVTNVVDIVSGGTVMGLIESLNEIAAPFSATAISPVVCMTISKNDFLQFMYGGKHDTRDLRINLAKMGAIQLLQCWNNYPNSVAYTAVATHDLFSNCKVFVDEGSVSVTDDDAYLLKIAGEYTNEEDAPFALGNLKAGEVRVNDSDVATGANKTILNKVVSQKVTKAASVSKMSLSREASTRMRGRSSVLLKLKESKLVKPLEVTLTVTRHRHRHPTPNPNPNPNLP